MSRNAILLLSLVVVSINAPAGAAFDPTAGRFVYQKHCVNCHGVDGRPLVAGSPDFAVGRALNQSDRNLFDSIKDGKDLMPGYDRVISDAEIINVIAYLRTLQR